MPVSKNDLVQLIDLLKRSDYHFVTPTPATHGRVVARDPDAKAHTLAGIFGWTLPFRADALSACDFEFLHAAHLIEGRDGLWRSTVRVSSLDGELFVHSAYPTIDEDAVFFGPDSYRFARLIQQEMAGEVASPVRSILDIGTGSGVGAIAAAKVSGASRVVGTDINPKALVFASANAQAANVPVETRCSEEVHEGEAFDLVLANPPYIIDHEGRDYRDGGAMHGGEISLKMAEDGLKKLSPAGRFILYTGSAVVAGKDQLKQELAGLARQEGIGLDYREIDPDVFGEELVRDVYRDVDRIAVVAAVFSGKASAAYR